MGEAYFPAQLDELSVEVDVNKISQVIRNLVSNAIKFTPPTGQVTVKTYLTSRIDAAGNAKVHCEKKCVRFEVSDTGPGISEVSPVL